MDCSALQDRIHELEKSNLLLLEQLEALKLQQDQDNEILRFERLLSNISTRLIDLSADEVRERINLALEAITEFLGVDQIVITENSGGIEARFLYGFRKGNRPLAFPKDLKATFPYARSRIHAGKIIALGDLPRDVPQEAETDRKNCLKYGFRAVLGVPLTRGDVVVGSVVCYSFSGPRKWSPGVIQRLRLFGEIMSNTISRHRTETRLREAFVEIKALNDRLKSENLYLKGEIDLKHRHLDIVGKSRAIVRVLNLVEQVADTDATVMITGETGTGKELVARAIHRLSGRKDRPMVVLNCAALPPTLMESELFGHEKGAFTGALKMKPGRFEAAHESTLFLDEVDSLSLEMQAKLLRVIQEGVFERLGSHTTRKVNVRIIAASNKDLKGEVTRGAFRDDLFYRLNVFPIVVPPLRERIDDVPLLVKEFVKELSGQMGKLIDTIPAAGMETLKRFDWPGNVRELRNIIERAVIISKGNPLVLPPLDTRSGDVSVEIRTLDDVQRSHIESVLARMGWRVSGPGGAAQLLNINPKTLESRMKKLGIQRPS